jgi:retron-type reverse transcriptase
MMAKTYRNLYPEVASFGNLFEAWHKARKGKRGQAEVATFEFHLETNLLRLEAELRDRSYRPGSYRSFYIHEPKRRLISAAPFRDRVVHHALCNVIEPICERRFIRDSYANRIGKGTHRALDRCTYFMRRYRYVLPCDVKQYFPSVDHAILRGILSRHLADPDVLWLIDQILASGVGVLSDEYDQVWFPGDDLLAADRPRGLPIGNLTSQHWANVYLNELDQFVKRELKCPAYLRYVDDFQLFHDDLDQLHHWRERVIEFLASMRLTLHGGRACPRPVTEGVSFLGFIVFPDHRRLRRHKGVYFERRLRHWLADYRAGRITLEDLQAHVGSWVNHARYGDTYGLRRAILGSTAIPRRELTAA